MDIINQSALQIDLSSLPAVVVKGDVDFRCVEEIRAAISDAIELNPHELAIDLSEAVFCDSSGVGVLIDSREAAEGVGCRLLVRSASRQVLRALQFSGLADIFNLPVLRIESTDDQEHTELRTADWDIYEYAALAEPDLVVSLRGLSNGVVSQLVMDDEKAGDMHLAVGEALVNALRHGSLNGSKSVIRLRCLTCTGSIVIEVCDEGEEFDFYGMLDADPRKCEQMGMGLRIIAGAMDEVDYCHTEKGNRLRMIKWM